MWLNDRWEDQRRIFLTEKSFFIHQWINNWDDMWHMERKGDCCNCNAWIIISQTFTHWKRNHMCNELLDTTECIGIFSCPPNHTGEFLWRPNDSIRSTSIRAHFRETKFSRPHFRLYIVGNNIFIFISVFFICHLDGTVSGCYRKPDNESLLYDNIDMSSWCEILPLQYETPQQGIITNRTLNSSRNRYCNQCCEKCVAVA